MKQDIRFADQSEEVNDSFKLRVHEKRMLRRARNRKWIKDRIPDEKLKKISDILSGVDTSEYETLEDLFDIYKM